MDARFLERSPFASDEGQAIGRVPRKVKKTDLERLGHPPSPIKAIRAKCLDCALSEAEVRKCHITSCALWPFRMGANPFHGRAKSEAD